MTFYRFEEEDKLTNQLRTYPSNTFFIHDSNVVYNKTYRDSGSFADPVTFADQSEKSLYELNVDRKEDNKIYPFVTKEGARTNLGTVSTDDFNSNFTYGDKITGSYPFTSSIARDYFKKGESRKKIRSLRNSFNFHSIRSVHYQYSSSLGDKSDQKSNLISIPKIFYGDKLKKDSFKLDFHISGALLGRLEDEGGNGELIQTAPSGSPNSGAVAGVCMYDEGFVYLTGSWDLDPGGPKRDYIDDSNDKRKPKWIYFGAGISDSFSSGIIPSSSFRMSFRGRREVANISMFAKAPKGQLNYSSNPTFVESASYSPAVTSSQVYSENENNRIRNVVSKSYSDPTASFEKTTFINQVAIYDEDKKLLGVAKTSNPVKKEESDSHMFKLKFDY